MKNDDCRFFSMKKIDLDHHLIDEHFDVYDQVFKDDRSHQVACFKDIMMIDLDTDTLPSFPLMEPFQNDTFAVYKTRKGYHLYCTSRYISHKSFDLFSALQKIGCDPKYLTYVYRYGWMVRLTPKIEYENDEIESFLFNSCDHDAVGALGEEEKNGRNGRNEVEKEKALKIREQNAEYNKELEEIYLSLAKKDHVLQNNRNIERH